MKGTGTPFSLDRLWPAPYNINRVMTTVETSQRANEKPEDLWLGPGVAAVSGVVAAMQGLEAWDANWPRAILLVLLAGLGWGALWRVAHSADWIALGTGLWHRYAPGSTGTPPSTTRRESPLLRFGTWLGGGREWWRNDLEVQDRYRLHVAFVAVLLTFGVAAALGPSTILLSVLVLALTQLAWFLTEPGAAPLSFAQAVIFVAGPWLAAALLFGDLDAAMLFATAGLGLAYWGGAARPAPGVGGIALLLDGYALIVVALAVENSLTAAAVVGAMLGAHLTLAAWADSGDRALLALGQWPLLVAMFVTALAL